MKGGADMEVKFRMVKDYLGLIFVYREYIEGLRDIQVYEVYTMPNWEEGARVIFAKECEFAHSRRSFEKECSRIRRELNK